MTKTRKRRGTILVVLGFVLALISGAAVFFVLLTTQPTSPEVERTPVVVAWQPIPARHEITADEVAVINWPVLGDFPLPPGTFVDPNAVIGRLTLSPIGQGQAIISSVLVDKTQSKESASNASFLLERGMVAVAMPITQLSGVASAIQAGDRIDVIATFSAVESDALRVDPARATATQRTLQNLLVLQVGDWSNSNATDSGAKKSTQESVLTLQVTEQEAQILKYVEGKADQWTFVLRPVEDEQYYKTVPVTLDFMNRNYGYEFPTGQ